MAIFHFTTTPVCRSKGHSTTANSAYIGAKEITDERTGEKFNYTNKGGVLSNEIILPDGIDKQNLDSSTLWNMSEKAEKRADARTGREWEISLPHELNDEQKINLAKDITSYIANRYQVATEYAIHKPSREGSDERNYHVHILTSTRKIDANLTLGAKSDIELDRKQCASLGISNSYEQILELREQVANIINKHLELANIKEKVSHKTLKDQGIDREPTRHMGKIRTEIERRERKQEQELQQRETKIEKILYDFSPVEEAKRYLAKLKEPQETNAQQVEIKPKEEELDAVARAKKFLEGIEVRSNAELLQELRERDAREQKQEQEQKQKMSRGQGFSL